MLRLKLIESDDYYTAVRRLTVVGLLIFLPWTAISALDLPEGIKLALTLIGLGILFYQIRHSLRIRNNTDRRRLEVDEEGVRIRISADKLLEKAWNWSEMEAVEVVMERNLADLGWSSGMDVLLGKEPKNYIQFDADGKPHRFDFLLESDYAEQRLRALVGERQNAISTEK